MWVWLISSTGEYEGRSSLLNSPGRVKPILSVSQPQQPALSQWLTNPHLDTGHCPPCQISPSPSQHLVNRDNLTRALKNKACQSSRADLGSVWPFRSHGQVWPDPRSALVLWDAWYILPQISYDHSALDTYRHNALCQPYRDITLQIYIRKHWRPEHRSITPNTVVSPDLTSHDREDCDHTEAQTLTEVHRQTQIWLALVNLMADQAMVSLEKVSNGCSTSFTWRDRLYLLTYLQVVFSQHIKGQGIPLSAFFSLTSFSLPQ